MRASASAWKAPWRWKSGPLREGLLIGLVAALLVTSAIADQDGTCLENSEYEKATRMILCDCGCHPQSVHDCACGRAAEMRREIHGVMSAQCLTGDDLIALYVEEHGDQIRIAPTASGFNILAWVGPSVGLIGTTGLVFLMLRRWSRKREEETGETPPPLEPVDERYRDRLRDALENLE